jgi:hypothetical protein
LQAHSTLLPGRIVAELRITNRITPTRGRSCRSPDRVSNPYHGQTHTQERTLGGGCGVRRLSAAFRTAENFASAPSVDGGNSRPNRDLPDKSGQVDRRAVRRVNGFRGCETIKKKREVKSATRKTDVWATQIRLRIYRPGHPPKKFLTVEPNLTSPANCL